MKKLFAILAMIGIFSFVKVPSIIAQESTEISSQIVQLSSSDLESDVIIEQGSIHEALKTKFIEGDAGFMSLVAIALVLGLAFCIERIIYLNLAEVNEKKLMSKIEAALDRGDVEGAKTVCRNTRGPIASICYQGLMRIDENVDVVERSVVSCGSVQAAYLENGCSWKGRA